MALGGCGRTDPSSGREALQGLNVLLVTIDTLRADHVSAYGDRARTPNIDRLAAEGALFERCIAQTPLTLPAHVTLLSGTYPLHHRVRGNGGGAAPGELELISESLRARGYATAAFIGAYVLHSKWGLAQGFDLYSDDFDRSRYGRILLQNEKRASEVIGPAREWIRDHRESKFFAWVHLFDPHTPYDPPAPFDEHADDPYRGEVEYTDAALGELVDFLRAEGLHDRTLIVLTADHGESLGEHGEREHGLFLYEPTVRVPLIVRGPVEFPVRRVRPLVEHVDVVPTILDLVGVPIPTGVQGESLADVLFGAEPEGEPTAYTETFYPRLHLGWSELLAFYQGDMKYVRAPRDELFDLGQDAGELESLASVGARESDRGRLRGELSAFVERQSKERLAPESAGVTREDVEALRALGYVAGGAAPEDGASLADPKDKVEVFNHLTDATARLDRGEVEAVIAAAKEVLRDEPNLVEAHSLLGHAHQRRGSFREAAESFERVLELRPDSNFAMIDLLSVLINLGETARVVERAPEFLARFPNDPVLLEELGVAHFHEGHYDEALASLERSIELGPSAASLTRAGEIHAIQGDLEAGESSLRRALALDPGHPGAYYSLGQIEEARGNLPAAVALYEKELENDPKAYRASFNVAVILKKQGRHVDAVDYYRKTLEANPGFNVPYFMLAEHLLEQGSNLDRAIELCQQGIAVAPEEKTALLGYEILLRLYMKMGDRASYELHAARAKALFETLEGGE